MNRPAMNSLAGFGVVVAVLAGHLNGPVLAAVKTIELPAEQATLKASDLPGYAIASAKCGICHSADYIQYQPPGMTQTQWNAEMHKMQHSYGAPIDEDEIKLLAIYLAATYGDESSVSAADRGAQLPPSSGAKANSAASQQTPTTTSAEAKGLLTGNGCLGCHSLQQKVVGPAYHDVAVKYHSDPDAVKKVSASIRAGGSGKWGPVRMPPFPDLNDQQLQILAEFILGQ